MRYQLQILKEQHERTAQRRKFWQNKVSRLEADIYGRIPKSDAQDDNDINDLHQRRVIYTEPGESIETPYLTDCTGVMPPNSI